MDQVVYDNPELDIGQADLRQLAKRLPSTFEFGLATSRRELPDQAGAKSRPVRPQSSMLLGGVQPGLRPDTRRSSSFLEPTYLNPMDDERDYQNEQPVFGANRPTIIDTSSDSSQRTGEMLLSPRLLDGRKLNDDSYCN